MYENTLWEVRHYVASSVSDLLYGVCGTTGATTTKIHAPFLWQADDYYNNNHYEVYVYLGTNKGVTKRVTDWVNTGNLLTVHSAYTAACDATSYIELHKIFTADEYNKAINLAIESIADKYLINKIDETITLVADVTEYTVPDEFDYVHKITEEETADTGEFYDAYEVDSRQWGIISPRTLKLSEAFSITAGKDLRIEGQGRQNTVSDDIDKIYIPPDWLVNKAITFLPQNKIQSGGLDATYRNALVLSAREPRNWANPRAKSVID